MVSPNLQRFTTIPRGERLVPQRSKFDSRCHPKSSFSKHHNIRGDERTLPILSDLDHSYACHDRNPFAEYRDDLPPQRDRTDDVYPYTSSDERQNRPSSSTFYRSEPQSITSDVIPSPPRLFRRGFYRDDEDHAATLRVPLRYSLPFPVQAQSHRNDLSQKSDLYRIPVSLRGHELIGDPHLNIHRLRLPIHLLPILDQIVQGCERYSQTLQHGWSTDLYSLTKQDIALREIPHIYEIAKPVTSYIYRVTSLLYGIQAMKVDHNQPHVLKYDSYHTGVELHHDKSDITMNVMLSRSDTYGGGGTFFPEANQNVRLEFGEFLLHPGGAVHGGTSITHGSRYLMVIFAHEKR